MNEIVLSIIADFQHERERQKKNPTHVSRVRIRKQIDTMVSRSIEKLLAENRIEEVPMINGPAYLIK